MNDSQRERLRPLLYAAYHASERPNEQRLVRMLGQAIFGADMAYRSLDGVPVPYTPPIPAGMKRHWVSNVGGRVGLFISNGWQHVYDQNDLPISRHVGHGQFAYALDAPIGTALPNESGVFSPDPNDPPRRKPARRRPNGEGFA